MSLVTADSIIELGPCERFPERRVRRLLKDGLPLAEALCVPRVRADDKVWAATEWLGIHDSHLLVCWYDNMLEPLACKLAEADGKYDDYTIERLRQLGVAWLEGKLPRVRHVARTIVVDCALDDYDAESVGLLWDYAVSYCVSCRISGAYETAEFIGFKEAIDTLVYLAQ